MTDVVVLGATSNLGLRLFPLLTTEARRQGFTLIAHAQDRDRLAALSAYTAHRRLADMRDQATLKAALAGATHIVSLVPLGLLPAALAAMPEGLVRLVAFGSTRVYTRFPTPYEHDLRHAKSVLLASGRPVVLLEPAMIYGGPREQNLARLIALLRRTPILPLPGGGRTLVQPIFVDDVARAAASALFAPDVEGRVIALAGSEALPYAKLVALCARQIGRRAHVLNVPLAPLRLAAAALRRIPGAPHIADAVLLRLTENRAYDISAMRALLGIEPTPLAEGLARAYGRASTP